MRISCLIPLAVLGTALAVPTPLNSHDSATHALASHGKRDARAPHLEKRHYVHWFGLFSSMFRKPSVKPSPPPQPKHYSAEDLARNQAKYLMCLLHFLNGPREERLNDYTFEEIYCHRLAGPFQGRRYYGLGKIPDSTGLSSEDIRIEQAQAKTEEEKRRANGEPSSEDLWNELHRVWREVKAGRGPSPEAGEGAPTPGHVNHFSMPSLKALGVDRLPGQVADSMKKAFGGRTPAGQPPPMMKLPRPL